MLLGRCPPAPASPLNKRGRCFPLGARPRLGITKFPSRATCYVSPRQVVELQEELTTKGLMTTEQAQVQVSVFGDLTKASLLVSCKSGAWTG